MDDYLPVFRCVVVSIIHQVCKDLAHAFQVARLQGRRDHPLARIADARAAGVRDQRNFLPPPQPRENFLAAPGLTMPRDARELAFTLFDRFDDIYRAAKRLGVAAPQLSVDTNEANPDAESVRDYYQRLRAADAEAFAALLFFEQPTGRDITIYRYEWHPIGAIKPVLLDEGLTSLDLMHEALAQGVAVEPRAA